MVLQVPGEDGRGTCHRGSTQSRAWKSRGTNAVFSAPAPSPQRGAHGGSLDLSVHGPRLPDMWHGQPTGTHLRTGLAGRPHGRGHLWLVEWPFMDISMAEDLFPVIVTGRWDSRGGQPHRV